MCDNEPNLKLRHKQKMAALVGGLLWFLYGQPLDKNIWMAISQPKTKVSSSNPQVWL